MIKILQIGLSNHLGGIETYLHKLCTHIDREKFKFDFLVTGFDKPCFYDEFLKMGSGFHFVTPRGKNPVKNRKEINKILEKEKYDIVHCNLNSLSYIYPALAALKNDIPTIIHSRNAGIKSSKISQILHNINFKKLPKEKITMLAVSSEAGNWMFGEETKFRVINNGIYTDKYCYNQDARIKTREKLKLQKQDKVLVNVGALKEQKNHEFLLEILKKLIETEANYKLLLVGKGNLENKLKEYAENMNIINNIIFLGSIDNVAEVLSAADVFVFPSLYEGFPNAVLEAQASGLPCVISDTITNEVIVLPNVEAISLEETPEYWANRVENISFDIEREEAYKFIESKKLTVTDEINKIEKIYIDLIS